jgi:RNA polymerase-interacting CarD/CdnL/TRCF family regulator
MEGTDARKSKVPVEKNSSVGIRKLANHCKKEKERKRKRKNKERTEKSG